MESPPVYKRRDEEADGLNRTRLGWLLIGRLLERQLLARRRLPNANGHAGQDLADLGIDDEDRMASALEDLIAGSRVIERQSCLILMDDESKGWLRLVRRQGRLRQRRAPNRV